MRVVLDTGILISALITTDTAPDQVYQAWRKKRFTLVTSAWQLGEFRRASRYPKVRKFLDPVEAGDLVNGLKRIGATRIVTATELLKKLRKKR
jgi:putative PIN family toxin of toxin-antitoxin system